MTWVIGSPTAMGYSVILADIQVTVETRNRDGSVDKRYLDGIQKVFDVGRYMAAGFAGSVRLGYQLVEDLAACLVLPADEPDTGWIPAWVVEKWRHRARSIYDASGANDDRDGVDLLVAGAWEPPDYVPSEADLLIASVVPPGVRTYACILRSPDFEVEVIKPMRVGSIGSGNEVDKYRRGLEHVNEQPAQYYQFDFYGATDSFGTMLGHSLGGDIARHPEPGISPHLHICIIRPGSITLQPNDSDTFVKGGRVPERRMPAVARSWPECEDLLQRHGIAARDVATAVA